MFDWSGTVHGTIVCIFVLQLFALDPSNFVMLLTLSFENMVLRRIFGPRRDEVTGEWRRLHNEELNDLYC